MGRIWLAPVVIAVWVCGANTAEACSCSPRSASCGPPADFWRAAAVFVGRVATVERVRDQGRPYTTQRRARVRILERFRGAIPADGGEITLYTGAASLCGYPFKAGQEYLIYAIRQEDGRMTTSICSRTLPLDRARIDLAYARQAAAGSAPSGRIVGEVRQATEDAAGWKPMRDFTIALIRNGVRITAVTDARGRYTFEPPEAGAYTFDIRLPDTLYTLHAAQSIELLDPHACVESNIDVLFNGHVSGRVTDSGGRGVAGLTVSYARPGRTEALPADRRRTLTRDDGSYELDRVPPGNFILTIELPYAGENRAVEEAAVEARVTLRGGQRLKVDTLVLPPTVRIVRLAGTVHSADGAPAAGARVFLKGGGETSHILGAPATTDALGRFLIAALDGERYQVFAEQDIHTHTAASSAEFSEPVTVNASFDSPPLRLTVRRRF